MAPTVALMDAELAVRVGRQLTVVGLFATNADGSSQVCRIGLRKGIKEVGLVTADPFNVSDSDIAILSDWALERVLDEAELYSLQQALLGWWRAEQSEQVKAIEAATDTRGGWLYSLQQSIKARIAELKIATAEPFEEPFGSVAVADGLADLTPPRLGAAFRGLSRFGFAPDSTLPLPFAFLNEGFDGLPGGFYP